MKKRFFSSILVLAVPTIITPVILSSCADQNTFKITPDNLQKEYLAFNSGSITFKANNSLENSRLIWSKQENSNSNFHINHLTGEVTWNDTMPIGNNFLSIKVIDEVNKKEATWEQTIHFVSNVTQHETNKTNMALMIKNLNSGSNIETQDTTLTLSQSQIKSNEIPSKTNATYIEPAFYQKNSNTYSQNVNEYRNVKIIAGINEELTTLDPSLFDFESPTTSYNFLANAIYLYYNEQSNSYLQSWLDKQLVFWVYAYDETGNQLGNDNNQVRLLQNYSINFIA